MALFPCILTFLLFGTGLLMIIKGGDYFVDAAVYFAKATGLPLFIIGATIVSLATTLPEIIVSVIATSRGNYSMATGNAVGSVTSNTAMILGIAMIFLPSVFSRKQYIKKISLLIASIILLWLFSLGDDLSVTGAIIMFGIFGVFIVENIHSAKRDCDKTTKATMLITKKEIVKNIILFFVGSMGIVLGSELLVDNGTILAHEVFNIDDRIISLTAVAIGTSLPELVTTITAISKKQSALSFGNIIGANIIDISLILPVCTFISDGNLFIEHDMVLFDLPICLLCTIIVFIPALINGRTKRYQGLISLLTYIAYLVFICIYHM